MSCSCDPDSISGHYYNKFIAYTFGECVYYPREVLSFYIGMSSLFFWICCQIPQFYKNYINKSGSALSKWFLIEWFMGDALNLFGCILTHQLVTQLATSVLFVFVDFAMICQIVYYIWRAKDDDSSADDLEVFNEEEDAKALVTEGRILSNVSNNVNDKADRASGYKMTTNSSDNGSHKAVDTERKQENSVMDNDATPERSLNLSSKIGKPLLVLPLAVVATCAFFAMGIPSEANDSTGIAFVEKHPSLPDCESHIQISKLQQQIGLLVGWVSALVYLNSRIPQILKNYKRKSVEGLSLIMFFCAVMGNTTYGLGVLLKDSSLSAIKKSLPWLVGSLGTLSLDFIIMLQFYVYRGSRKQDSLLHLSALYEYDGYGVTGEEDLKRPLIGLGNQRKKGKRKRLNTPIRGLYGLKSWTNSPFMFFDKNKFLMELHDDEESNNANQWQEKNNQTIADLPSEKENRQALHEAFTSPVDNDRISRSDSV